MLNYARLFSASFALLLLLVPNLILTISSSAPYHPKDHYFISCGLPYKSSSDGGTWRSDEDPTFSPSASAMAAATTSATGDNGAQPPYDMARIFRAPIKYSIPVSSPGPMLVRLYFSPSTAYNNIHPSNFYISVNANSFNLLTNFSAYLASVNAKANPYNAPVSDEDYGLVKEFYLTVSEADQRVLSLTISPFPSLANNSPSVGFLNGIEIISAPNGLYIPDPNNSNLSVPVLGIPYLQGIPDDYSSNFFNFSDPSLALEAIIRLNVGGADVSPSEDSGLNRTWYDDSNFLLNIRGVIPYNILKGIKYTSSRPPYTAPETVYSSMRKVGPNLDLNLTLRTNMTWVFEVDGGFNYLVRLHFCDLLREIDQTDELYFDIYVNNQTAAKEVDVFHLAGGQQIPIYKDFVTYVDGSGGNTRNESRVHLPVALHPDLAGFRNADAFLNGLEIFKLSNESRSLAAPNPSLPVPDGLKNVKPGGGKRSRHWLLTVIIVVCVLGLIGLLTFALFLYHHCRRKAMSKASINDTRKTKWITIGTIEFGSTTSSIVSSLPSDLCRRFSAAQIRVATSDFDESLVIGTGGFGKVYKGVIDGGATAVAIKRLNPTSKQGAREFRTEIEMLSRLRHLHLVSLIGYCEDHGEMILVYEYMPRGTLRDHLMYKNNNDSTITPLSWKQRLRICVGSARGLHYLHAGTKELIIHRDVKSTNILLDDKWTAKVSDFGLSKVGPTSESGIAHVSTAVKGSIGYLDPEYYKRQRLTEKSDVYSFGVVLFEVLCARPAANPSLPKEQVNLAKWARWCYKNGTLRTIVDPNLTGQVAPESLSKFGEIAEMCVRDEGSQRPLMGDVVWALEFALELQETADKNNINGGPSEGMLGPTIASNGGDGGTTDDDIFSATGENLSNTSGTSVILSNDHAAMRSGSIFSEIMNPKAR